MVLHNLVLNLIVILEFHALEGLGVDTVLALHQVVGLQNLPLAKELSVTSHCVDIRCDYLKAEETKL